jgi:hypothetical protein
LAELAAGRLEVENRAESAKPIGFGFGLGFPQGSSRYRLRFICKNSKKYPCLGLLFHPSASKEELI